MGVSTPLGSFWPFRKVPFMVPISSATKRLPFLDHEPGVAARDVAALVLVA